MLLTFQVDLVGKLPATSGGKYANQGLVQSLLITFRLSDVHEVEIRPVEQR